MLIEIAAAATAGGFIGFFTCAVMTMGKASDGQAALTEHVRLSDALATKQARIDRALEQVTPGSNATVTRMARILRGDA